MRRGRANNSSELVSLYRDKQALNETIESLHDVVNKWKQFLLEYGTHRDHCRIVQLMEAGRVPKPNQCNCGLEELRKKAKNQL